MCVYPPTRPSQTHSLIDSLTFSLTLSLSLSHFRKLAHSLARTFARLLTRSLTRLLIDARTSTILVFSLIYLGCHVCPPTSHSRVTVSIPYQSSPGLRNKKPVFIVCNVFRFIDFVVSCLFSCLVTRSLARSLRRPWSRSNNLHAPRT